MIILYAAAKPIYVPHHNIPGSGGITWWQFLLFIAAIIVIPFVAVVALRLAFSILFNLVKLPLQGIRWIISNKEDKKRISFGWDWF